MSEEQFRAKVMNAIAILAFATGALGGCVIHHMIYGTWW